MFMPEKPTVIPVGPKNIGPKVMPGGQKVIFEGPQFFLKNKMFFF